MLILGIETSCDETAAAVVACGRVLSSVVATQVPVHARYGGVVPELASRNHLLDILPVIERALSDASTPLDAVDAIAVTRGPGLVGSLLVGLQTAKTLAWARGLPLVGVDHVEAHITAALLGPEPPEFPYVALAVSGGHTSLTLVEDIGRYSVVGHTLDDAAGEAFDKVAKMMGLPYPGGVAIDLLSEGGDPGAVELPRALMARGNVDFSFSGLKTAVRYHLEGSPAVSAQQRADLAASVQEAIVDALVEKSARAAESAGVRSVVLAGGVAANRRLRSRAAEVCAARGLRLTLTPLDLCTDNAAMVAGLGARLLERGGALTPQDAAGLDVYANVAAGSPRSTRVRRR
ncbi:MAG: tRNA N6-adenosine threonylcarbamoyltransferase [Myxococcales bacterium]